MAVIFKCDRCGTIYEDKDSNDAANFNPLHVEYKVTKYYGYSALNNRTYDLCPDCRAALVEFMEPKPKEVTDSGDNC